MRRRRRGQRLRRRLLERASRLFSSAPSSRDCQRHQQKQQPLRGQVKENGRESPRLKAEQLQLQPLPQLSFWAWLLRPCVGSLLVWWECLSSISFAARAC